MPIRNVEIVMPNDTDTEPYTQHVPTSTLPDSIPDVDIDGMTRSQAVNLYTTHFLSTWNVRTYEFAAVSAVQYRSSEGENANGPRLYSLPQHTPILLLRLPYGQFLAPFGPSSPIIPVVYVLVSSDLILLALPCISEDIEILFRMYGI